MRSLSVNVVLVAVLSGCGGGEVMPDEGDTGPNTDAGSLADCTTEVAPGYPRVGPAGCQSHVSYRIDGHARDDAQPQGLIEVGHGLARLVSSSDTALTLTLPLSTEALQSYTTADCIDSNVTFGSTTYLSSLAWNASRRRLTVTVSRSSGAVWGDFEGDYCRVRGYINVGGEVTANYDCRRVSGKFAALVEAQACTAQCGEEVKLVGNSCVLPTCTSKGACAATYCPARSATCQAVLPVPDGTYRARWPVAAFPSIEVDLAHGALVSLTVERSSPAGTSRLQVTHDPPATLARENGGWFISETLRADGGTAELFRMNVVEQRAADGGVELKCRSASVSGASTDYLGDFVLPRLK